MVFSTLVNSSQWQAIIFSDNMELKLLPDSANQVRLSIFWKNRALVH